MQPLQSSRIDLGNLKARIVKSIGAEKAKSYFYYLNRFLSQKLSKGEFDKLCCQALGRENLPLHNQLLLSILKNSCLEGPLQPISDVGSTKSTLTAVKGLPAAEDGHGQSRPLLQNQNHKSSIQSNGVIPMSPQKGKSTIRDRKLKDLPSPLGPNGKVVSLNCSVGAEGKNKIFIENGVLMSQDDSRSLQHLQMLMELPEESEGLIPQCLDRPTKRSKKDSELTFTEDVEEMEQDGCLGSSKTPLQAQIGVPFGRYRYYSAGTSGDVLNCQDLGVLFDVETLRRRMQQIVVAQGLGGVSMECTNVLNTMLDVYLKQLISSSVEVAWSRPMHQPQMILDPRQQLQGRILNGMQPCNANLANTHNCLSLDGMEVRRPQSISLLDFKVAMELNPQLLGEAWPLLLELISTS
ncbi:hypothetical protein SAY87_026026 [Trapa incisa]|uniref:Transcriptional coactivator Hfi1/Transcriptional adapter 1 n=1 Tax=Trapa incisa TaxID=236973 RepID=A0AAN7GRF0_9MYRT|nr:hypothetical protein SAY87_026026 [Trapa incisa]